MWSTEITNLALTYVEYDLIEDATHADTAAEGRHGFRVIIFIVGYDVPISIHQLYPIHMLTDSALASLNYQKTFVKLFLVGRKHFTDDYTLRNLIFYLTGVRRSLHACIFWSIYFITAAYVCSCFNITPKQKAANRLQGMSTNRNKCFNVELYVWLLTMIIVSLINYFHNYINIHTWLPVAMTPATCAFMMAGSAGICTPSSTILSTSSAIDTPARTLTRPWNDSCNQQCIDIDLCDEVNK